MFPKVPSFVGWGSMILNAVLYGLLKWWLGPVICEAGLWFADEISFLDRMALCFVTVLIFATAMSLIAPKEVLRPEAPKEVVDLTISKSALIGGILTVLLTVVLYIIFL